MWQATILRISSSFLVVVLLLLSAFTVQSQRTGRSLWPKKGGVYIATSSETIPLFPRVVSGYRPSGNNKDFWDHAFSTKGTIRIFEGGGWTGITDFPATMNGCSSGIFMIRWRSANPDVRIASVLSSSIGDGQPYRDSGRAKTAAFGYMGGINCEQPMFKFVGTLNGNESSLVDIYYELKFWQAAP
jgi:hypothetical protein